MNDFTSVGLISEEDHVMAKESLRREKDSPGERPGIFNEVKYFSRPNQTAYRSNFFFIFFPDTPVSSNVDGG